MPIAQPAHSSLEYRARQQDVSAIAAAGLTIAGARWSRDGRKVVLTTSDGTILVSYGAFEAAETLTDDWRSHWNAWRESFDEPVHPLVREWLVKGKGASVDTLLETWRRERTSDLATLVDRLDAPMA